MNLPRIRSSGHWPRLNLGSRLTLSIGLVIALTTLVLFVGIYRMQERQTLEHMNTEAHAILTEMIVLREWVSSYGGVWTTRPGDYYLESAGDYYLKTPAMVTKELSKLSDKKGYYRFHITSLKLMNEENAPDDFEHDALVQFELEPQPIAQVERGEGISLYRLMIPLYVEESCLQCHSTQDYQVGDVRGGLSVLVPMAQIDRSLADNRKALIYSAFGIATLVMGVLYVLVRRTVSGPVKQLTAVAGAVGQGDYEARCDLRTGNELEILGDTLNQMVSNLRDSRDDLNQRIEQRTRELAAISEISLIISRAGALEDVLQEALEKVVRVAGAQGGAVFLSEEPGIRLAANDKLSEPILNCLRTTQQGSGQIHKVTQKGEPLYLPDLRWESRRKVCLTEDCPSFAADYASLVTVPLSSRSRTLGTITLLGRKANSFSPETLQLLACIGQQLGVAVENAWFQHRTEQIAILEERQRISREMHDSLAQTLSWLNLKTEMLEEDLQREQTQKIQSDVAMIRRAVRDACYDVRESIDGLRAGPSGGIVTAVATWISDFRKRTGLATEFHAADSEVKLSPVVESEMVRILQEALTNVRKHAQAQRVLVRLQIQGRWAELVVEDDGQGFVYNQQQDQDHFGLRIMRERAERLRGTFTIETAPGQGARVIVRIPVHPHLRSEIL